MPYYEFTDNDVIYNVIETNPEVEFFIYNNQVYYNNEREQYNAFTSSVELKHAGRPSGHINLYEMNVSRPTGHLIYPFVIKDGTDDRVQEQFHRNHTNLISNMATR